jgi:hypothetical protein
MNKVKEKTVRLKNRYTGDEVCTDAYDDVVMMGDNFFIRVYHPTQPHRTYLANRSAFEVLTK